MTWSTVINVLLILLIFSALCYLVYTAWQVRRNCHMLQLYSYRPERYAKWIKENVKAAFSWHGFIPLLSLLLLYAGQVAAAAVLWALIYILLIARAARQKEKKKFVVTARVKRLLVTLCLLFLGLVFLIYISTQTLPASLFLIFWAASLIAVNIMVPVWVLLAGVLNLPLENRINKWYLDDARRIIKGFPSLKIIGITGSYGKTSTKYILSKILADRFNVLMTPESYNTPMGVTITIRTILKPIHEVLVVEMGARKPGDIKEICDLVQPHYGILTSVGPQHLEYFGSLDNVRRTKYELLEALPENGIAFINRDLEVIREHPPATRARCVYYGLESPDLDYYARDISFTARGSVFTACSKKGEEVVIHSRLLGRHNIYNILAAIAVAGELGQDLKSITPAVAQINPVPHRLEIRSSNNGVTIIDDSFNSNPEGAASALEVLDQMEGRVKILVTPGMVELGEQEYQANKNFGMQAAGKCDYVILVASKQTAAVLEGLVEAGFSPQNILMVNNLDEAAARLPAIASPGSVVLFENDLPDNY